MQIDLPPTLQMVLTLGGALAGALGLTGMIGPWVVKRWKAGATAELAEQLGHTFVTVESLNAFSHKWTSALDGLTLRVDGEMCELERKVGGAVSAAVNAASEASDARSAADDAKDLAERVEQRVGMLEQSVIPQLRDISKQLQEQSNHLSKQTGVLETFMEEYRSRR
jgi:hypothetical protein